MAGLLSDSYPVGISSAIASKFISHSRLLGDLDSIVITHFGAQGCCGCLIYSQTHAVSSLLAFLFSFSAFCLVSRTFSLSLSLSYSLLVSSIKHCEVVVAQNDSQFVEYCKQRGY